MAENKTRPTAESVEEFLANVENERRRQDARELVQMMREETGAEPKLWGPNIVGFGEYRYKYDSGREGDWFLAGFSPRKSSLVLYINSGFSKHAELMKRLGKHRTGKSCLYVNTLADVDLDVLRQLVRHSVAHVKAHSAT